MPSPWCANELRVTGSREAAAAARRTLRKKGFMDSASDCERPFDGHWETGEGGRVIIDGATVRWPKNETSDLRIHGGGECSLSVGEDVYRGRLVTMPVDGWVQQEIRWDDGDVWLGGADRAREIAGSHLFEQTMTEVLRDQEADALARRKTAARLRCVNTACRNIMSVISDDTLLRFVGGDVYYVEVRFLTKVRPPWVTGSFLNLISWKHPNVEWQHRWAEQTAGFVGQRRVSRGVEVEDACYGRALGQSEVTRHAPGCADARCGGGVCLPATGPSPSTPRLALPASASPPSSPDPPTLRPHTLAAPPRRREGQEHISALSTADEEIRYSGSFANLLAFSDWGRPSVHAPTWPDLV